MNRFAADSLAGVLADFGMPVAEYEDVVRRKAPLSYEEWVTRLYREVDRALKGMQDAAHEFLDCSEDALTHILLIGLRGARYRASAKTVRGNVDIVVESDDEEFRWLGEAKKFTGSHVHIKEGFLQLMTRYTDGTDGAAGLLVYVNQTSCAKVVAKWRERVRAAEFATVDTQDDSRPLTFRSTHTHEVSGLPVTVRHHVVPMRFTPKDKSARNSKTGVKAASDDDDDDDDDDDES